MRASDESHLRGSAVFVSFLRSVQKLFPSLSPSVCFPPPTAATCAPLVVPTAENRLACHSLRDSGPLSTDRIGHILHDVDRCRPVLRQAPGVGRSVCRAALVVRSVKLVHQRIESGEAGMCSSWPMLPVSNPRRSCSARFSCGVQPPFYSTCPMPGACSITRWFALRQPF